VVKQDGAPVAQCGSQGVWDDGEVAMLVHHKVKHTQLQVGSITWRAVSRLVENLESMLGTSKDQKVNRSESKSVRK
jgi:hypothetical protein